MFTQATHVIAVLDLERSLAFYRDVLGFTIHELSPGWRLYVAGACRIMAGECRDALPPRDTGDHSYFAHLVVDDIDELYARVAGCVEIVKALRDEPWHMREFGLRTADGHRIMIAAPL